MQSALTPQTSNSFNMDWELEQAKMEFVRSGLTISQLLSQKGWSPVGEIDGQLYWCARGKDLKGAMPESQALEQVLRKWYDD